MEIRMMDDWCKKVCANYKENCMRVDCCELYTEWQNAGYPQDDLLLTGDSHEE